MSSRRPGTTGFRGVVLSAAASALLLAGCAAGPLAVDAPSPEESDVVACEDFVAALPDELAGEDRREVTGGGGLVAAWGDPAIVLTCGVPPPGDFTETSTCIEANGTGWYVPDSVLLSDDESLDVTMTAVGFRPRVQVFLPGDYRPDGFLDVAAAIGSIVAADLAQADACR